VPNSGRGANPRLEFSNEMEAGDCLGEHRAGGAVASLSSVGLAMAASVAFAAETAENRPG